MFEFRVIDARVERLGPVAVVDGREALAQPDHVVAARAAPQGQRFAVRRSPQQDVIAEPQVGHVEEPVRDADTGNGKPHRVALQRLEYDMVVLAAAVGERQDRRPVQLPQAAP